jgi:hypothetical protein
MNSVTFYEKWKGRCSSSDMQQTLAEDLASLVHSFHPSVFTAHPITYTPPVVDFLLDTFEVVRRETVVKDVVYMVRAQSAQRAKEFVESDSCHNYTRESLGDEESILSATVTSVSKVQ